ncbi:hypothetical protein STCU_11516 [Strigomonas culicis]|uniref:Uncharacterized protein n=1 Tax=Strigomonas culicis TaxID=28005 RepID=S9TII7_9TRYP|nr:hypothetical protein STCU_11516 [Strigomonas culicis]|eukprot:EPY16158.1 hypothetical protein STCU_11516 [Strigomonas culicis]
MRRGEGEGEERETKGEEEKKKKTGLPASSFFSSSTLFVLFSFDLLSTLHYAVYCYDSFSSLFGLRKKDNTYQ